MKKHFYQLLFICLSCLNLVAQDELQKYTLTDSITVAAPLWVLPTELPENGTISGSHAEKNIRYRSTTRRGKLHGAWLSWYEDGSTHDAGNFKMGLPEGEWKVWYPNGQLQYVRHFSSENYLRLKEEWLRPHPKMPHSALAVLHQKNKQAALESISSKTFFTSNKNNDDYFPVFNWGLLHGRFINYHENGTIKDSGVYVNGVKEGFWIEGAGKNGDHFSGTYKRGVKAGSWKYIKGSRTAQLLHYDKGKLIWEKSY